MKKKILGILKEAINTFNKIKEIRLIATFGSVIESETKSFDDLDIIMISNKKTHNEFFNHFKKLLKKKNFEPIVFETVLKKPKKITKKQILIHDLSYRSLSDLKKKEWKSIINTMKSDMLVLYGDKNFPNKLPFYKLSKKELLNPLYKWAKKISSEDEFIVFRYQMLKTVPFLKERYDYLNLDNLREIRKILNRKLSWRIKLKQVTFLLR